MTVFCDGGYTTNLPLEDIQDGKAWVAYEYDGEPLEPAHGGPARLLVPHLYFWKSAKWVRGLRLTLEEEPGFWEQGGYHIYGDPWREQRYWGDWGDMTRRPDAWGRRMAHDSHDTHTPDPVPEPRRGGAQSGPGVVRGLARR